MNMLSHCYLPPDTDERAHLNPSQTGWYSPNIHQCQGMVYLPYRDVEKIVIIAKNLKCFFPVIIKRYK